MRRLVLGLTVALAVATAMVNIAFAQEPEFRMGFKSLAERIPDLVGQPLDNEQFNPQTGQSVQPTTRGLMVWRRADNSTSFTDGSITTILGPFGLQRRPNDTLFAWERPAAEVSLPTTEHSSPTLSLGVAIQQLATVPAGRELLDAAAGNDVLILRAPLPPNALGAFLDERKLAILSTLLDPTPSTVRAAVLAHELQHAADAATIGVPETAVQCFRFEARAFLRQAQVWDQLWQGNLPPDSNPFFAELNDITRTVIGNPEAFVAQLVERYRSECGPLP